jgi:N-methylhydantoinase B
VEITEATSPLVIRHKELRPDSGGPGKYRGGLGQRIEVEVRTGEPFVVSSLSDRLRFPANGYMGGRQGAPGGFTTSLGEARNPKLSNRLPANTTFVLELPGGGGFYDPKERDPAAVAADVAEGLVTPDRALADYGVRVNDQGERAET